MKSLGMKEVELLSMDGIVSSREVKEEDKTDNPSKKKNTKKNRHGFINKIQGMTIFDMLWGYKKIYGKHPEGNGLHQTGLRHAGIGKSSTNITEEEWYNEDLPEKNSSKLTGFYKFIYYGVLDTILMHLIEEECAILKTYYIVTSFTCVEWKNVHQTTVILDTASLNFKDPDMFLSTKHHMTMEEMDDVRVKGALVKEPLAGFYLGMTIVLDLSREYPNLIRAGNMGLETFIPEEQHEKYKNEDVVKVSNGCWYRKDPVSFMSKFVSFMFKLRVTIEKIRDQYEIGSEKYETWDTIKNAIKSSIINGIYGWFCSPWGRQFHEPSGKTITFLGRDLFEHNETYIKYTGVEIYKKTFLINGKKITGIVLISNYGDTDSIMVFTNSLELDLDIDTVIKLGYILEEHLNKSYDIFVKKHNLVPGYTKIAFEAIYLNMFFPKMEGEDRGTKKTYSGYVLWKNGKKLDKKKFFLKGISGKKGNSPILSKNIQTTLLKRGCDGQQKDEILPFLRKIVDEAIDCMTPG